MTSHRVNRHGERSQRPARKTEKVNRYYTGDVRGRSGMDGVFPLAELSPLGTWAWDMAVKMIGRSPTYRGVNRSGIFLKWLIRDGAEGKTDQENLMVLRDRMLDAGVEVTLTVQSNIGSVGRRRKNETPEAYRERCPERLRCYIKLTLS